MENLNVDLREIVSSIVMDALIPLLSEGDRTGPPNPQPLTVLLGDKAALDSIALVTLIIDIEQRLEEQFGVSLTLANDRAMSETNSPFRTPQSLTDYIVSEIEMDKSNG